MTSTGDASHSSMAEENEVFVLDAFNNQPHTPPRASGSEGPEEGTPEGGSLTTDLYTSSALTSVASRSSAQESSGHFGPDSDRAQDVVVTRTVTRQQLQVSRTGASPGTPRRGRTIAGVRTAFGPKASPKVIARRSDVNSSPRIDAR